jgi:hypothetical protein
MNLRSLRHVKTYLVLTTLPTQPTTSITIQPRPMGRWQSQFVVCDLSFNVGENLKTKIYIAFINSMIHV